jgi:hypothetical protein
MFDHLPFRFIVFNIYWLYGKGDNMPIPKEMQSKYNEIAALIIEFCDKKLNDDYKSL